MATPVQLCALLLLLTSTYKVHAQITQPCIPISTSYALLADDSPSGTLVQEFTMPSNIGGVLFDIIVYEPLPGLYGSLDSSLEGIIAGVPRPILRTRLSNAARDRPFGYVSSLEVAFYGDINPCIIHLDLVRRQAPMITSAVDYSGLHTIPLTINVSAPATGLSSYTICGSNNSRVASHLQLLDLSNGTGLQLAIVSTQSQPDLVRLGYDSGNLTIDLCLTDNGFNKTSMYNSSLYTSLHTASARHTIILPLEEVLSSCTLPTVPRNGQVSARWLLYNESLNFTCNDGYYLTGPANVTCLDDGNVTDSARTDCLPVNCTRPSTPKNGQLSQGPFNYVQPLIISCNAGYRLTGPSSVRCLANSASTGSSMTFCVPVNCTPPSAPENAKISEGPFNFEQPLIISCNSGYGLTGPSSVRCLANGTSTNSSKSSCVDMDECRLPAPVCHSKGATCTNTIGNFSCTCSFGYSGDGFICEEVENCSPGMCDSRANCTSVIGSVYCRCHAGYTGSGWPGSCFNVNECVMLTP
eukprot:scpid68883/ scgid1521/ Sushi, von Willebrand factor type A, EGF and pentraxin domain-containing protein 1; Polydom